MCDLNKIHKLINHSTSVILINIALWGSITNLPKKLKYYDLTFTSNYLGVVSIPVMLAVRYTALSLTFMSMYKFQ